MKIFCTLSRRRRLEIVMITVAFVCLMEIIVGRFTSTLVLIADGSHLISDLLSYSILYASARLFDPSGNGEEASSRQGRNPNESVSHTNTRWKHRLTFGGIRADVLSAFFNGAFLIAIGTSIFLQAIERFVQREAIQHPQIVIIVGAIALVANCMMAAVCHQVAHPSEPQATVANDLAWPTSATSARPSLAIRAAALHILGDAMNTVGVVIVGVISYCDRDQKVAYVDAVISLCVGLGIVVSAVPITLRTSFILLEAAPQTISIDCLRAGLLRLSGVHSVGKLRVWQLDESTTLASISLRIMLPVEKDDGTIASSTYLGQEKKGRESAQGPWVRQHLDLLGDVKTLLHSWGIADSFVEVAYIQSDN